MKIKTVQNSQRSNSHPRHAVMIPPCKTSHTFFMTSMKAACQYKIRKYEQSNTSKKKMRVSEEELYETGKVRVKRRLYPEKYTRFSQNARTTIQRRQKNPRTIKENNRAAQEERSCKYVSPIHSTFTQHTHHSMST